VCVHLICVKLAKNGVETFEMLKSALIKSA
jgi:hypothetical protein